MVSGGQVLFLRGRFPDNKTSEIAVSVTNCVSRCKFRMCILTERVHSGFLSGVMLLRLPSGTDIGDGGGTSTVVRALGRLEVSVFILPIRALSRLTRVQGGASYGVVFTLRDIPF